MSSVLADLTEIIDRNSFQAPDYSETAASAVIKAGWRPPARIITDPVELAQLPAGSIVRGCDVPHLALLGIANRAIVWTSANGQMQTSAMLLTDCRGAGVTVLYTPGDTK